MRILNIVPLIVLMSYALFARLAAGQLPWISVNRPLALDRLQNPPSDLFALTPSAVITLRDDGQQLAVLNSFALPSVVSPSDIVVALINGQVSILVAGASAGTRGFVSLYSSTGKLLKSWWAQHPLCGMDYDGANIIYVASCNSSEVYRANLSSGDTVSFVSEIVGGHHLGPLIVDKSRGRLLVGEIDDGAIYELDLKKNRSQLLATGFGTPQAFTFSPNLQQLIVADSSRSKVYTLQLGASRASPTVYGTSTQFRDLDGVALLSNGRIAVADDRANCIFVLSPRVR